MLDKPGNPCYTVITKGKEKEIKKMAYTIYYYRNDTANTFETNDFRTACISAAKWHTSPATKPARFSAPTPRAEKALDFLPCSL